jgi:hypothetical protein
MSYGYVKLCSNTSLMSKCISHILGEELTKYPKVQVVRGPAQQPQQREG